MSTGDNIIIGLEFAVGSAAFAWLGWHYGYHRAEATLKKWWQAAGIMVAFALIIYGIRTKEDASIEGLMNAAPGITMKDIEAGRQLIQAEAWVMLIAGLISLTIGWKKRANELVRLKASDITPLPSQKFSPEIPAPLAIIAEEVAAVSTIAETPEQKVGTHVKPEPNRAPAMQSHPELAAYEMLALEKKEGFKHEALWLKCHAEASGEQERVEALYNKQRAQMLMAELLASQDASRDEVRARLADWRSSVTNANLQLQAVLEAARSLKTVSRQHETFVGINELQNARARIDEALSFFLTKTDQLKHEITPNEWQGNLPKPQFISASEVLGLLPWQECMKIVSDEQTKTALVNDARAVLASVDKLISKRQAQIELLSELSAKVRHKAKRRDIVRIADQFYNSCRFADVDYTELDEFNSRQTNHDLFAIAAFLGVFLSGVFLFARHQAAKYEQSAPRLQTSETLLNSQESRGVETSSSKTPSAPESSSANFRTQAEQGDPRAQTLLGVGLIDVNIAEAVKWFREAAEQGFPEAQFLLGNAYANGEGVPKDAAEAVKWFREAAEQGYVKAQVALGTFYLKETDPSKEEAVNWFQKAAEQDDANAQFNLGICYGNGIGVPKDSTQAVKWFLKSSTQQHSGAEYNLGIMYFNGIGVPKDETESVKWLGKAAEHGHIKAQFLMGVALMDGVGGVKDLVRAYKWLMLAGEEGDKKAMKRIGELDQILTHEMRVEGQRLAREFKPAPRP